jgi:two-component system sensor histidine kinase BaeS
MRLRLFHTLSLTLLAFTAAAVLSLGGLTAWHLQNGFGEYLAARDVQHFERFVGVVEARVTQKEGVDKLLAGQLDLRDLLDEINPDHPGHRRSLGSPSLPGRSSPPHERNSAPFPERIQVLALNGALLLGSPTIDLPGSGPMIERPLHAKDQVVALARMRPDPIVRTGAEARFLRDQYALIAAGALGLIVLALLTATRLARRWTKPLAAVQEATRRLAQGELTVRLPVEPHLAGRSDEIGDVIRNVNRMAEGLQKLEAARRRWLADISHELRTPLTVLRGDIEALNEGIRPLRPEAIDVLHEEVLRLNRLVDDLHLMAISDLQILPCHMASDDAVAMVQRLQGRYESRARAAGLSLLVQWPANVAVLNVHWDAGRIEQLMANLLENSLCYTHAPGQVVVRLELDDNRIRLVVEDSAPGVSDDQLPQLFEPLYRGDAARGNRSGGSGLGLAICQVIAEAHGGQLTVSASGLGGLTLTLQLPRTSDVMQAPLTRNAT